jgi:hypothetical protein
MSSTADLRNTHDVLLLFSFRSRVSARERVSIVYWIARLSDAVSKVVVNALPVRVKWKAILDRTKNSTLYSLSINDGRE